MNFEDIKVGDEFTYKGGAIVAGDIIYTQYVNKTLYITCLQDLKLYFDTRPIVKKDKYSGCYFIKSELKYLIFKSKCKTILPLP